jgi:phospholipid/cholesterol/gamma-HCH transport system substrate-binding protein
MTHRPLIMVLTVITGFLATAAGGVAVVDWANDDDNTVLATVADAGSLEEGNEVRVSGVAMGTISEIRLDGRQAELELNVDPAVLPLHEDASLTVRPVNLLGENYVDLDPGSDRTPFMSEQVIPRRRTDTAVTLQDVLDTFKAPTAASLAAVVTTLGEGLHGNGGRTAQALEKLVPAFDRAERLGDLLAEQNRVLSDLVAAVDPVAASLADDRGRTLDRLVQSATDTLAAVSAQQAALRETIARLPGTLVAAQRTLRVFGGVAEQATPTLRALRPLTGDLRDVVAEVEAFADSADPALASLEPVLDRAERLLDRAAPLVAGLRQAGPHLARAAGSLRPVSRELLDEHLHGVMEFVRKWALSTNGRDGLSHYFRGVLYLTPRSLQSIARSLVPPKAGTGAPEPSAPPVELPRRLPDVELPKFPGLDQRDLLHRQTDRTRRLRDGLLDRTPEDRDGLRRQPVAPDPTSALGLTSSQERALLGQLLGGDR